MNRGKSLTVSYIVIAAMFLIGIISGSRAVTTMVESASIERSCTIVIDAGHGGVDGGAISCTGKPESAFNLEIAQKLKDLLHFLGFNTNMIRSSDTSVYTKGETIAQKKISDLRERVRIVNKTENALLLSIHQNSFSDSRYSGAQIFYGSEEGSEALAEQLQAALVATINPGSRRKCKKSDGIYLMEHIECPGILVECGFLSNPEEEAKLQNPVYQRKLCCVIASAVSTYLSNT